MGDSYSPIERFIARILAATPRLKKSVKKAYQYGNWMLHRKNYSFRSTYALKVIGVTSVETFVGYYDKSPLSPDGKHVTYQSSTHPTHLAPDSGVPVEVVLAEAVSGRVIDRLLSSAYNWQQGTKLQWISNDRFVFNAYDGKADRYVAHVYDLAQRKVVQTLPMPIYDCFGGDFALTLNFDRLARLAPDYGYFCRMDRAFDLNAVHNDGVWRLDMATGESRLILSLEALSRLHPLPSMQDAQHSVNHIMIAPDGKRFMVIHRWYQSGRRYDRLVVAGVDGSEPVVLADEGMVSHCFWLDYTQIFGYLRHGGKDAYFMLDAYSGAVRQLGEGTIDRFGDGHPHIHGSKVLFDTYPNKARMKKLFLYNLESGAVEELGEFFEGFKFYGETRCDLHPRFSPDGKQVFFDSVHEGRRKLYCMDLES